MTKTNFQIVMDNFNEYLAEQDRDSYACDLPEKFSLNEDEIKVDKSYIRDIDRLRIPEPTRFYAVGDRVVYGAYDYSGIIEVCKDGKYYKAFSFSYHTKQNIPDNSSWKIHHVTWYEVVPYQTDEEIESLERFEEDDDIFFNYQQRDTRTLLYMCFGEYGFDLDPEYQRGHVWTEEQKVDLIDSIFKNVDIGKFTIIRRPWGDDPNKPKTQLLYEVLDGKQRITAMLDFYLGRLKYKGMYIHEMHPYDRNHFKNYRISYAETAPLTKEQKYRYFLKLNTTGTPVDPEHIKKVYSMWQKERKK